MANTVCRCAASVRFFISYNDNYLSIYLNFTPSQIPPQTGQKLLLSNIYLQMTTPTPSRSQITWRRKRRGLSSSTLAPALGAKLFSTPKVPQSQSKSYKVRLWCSRRLAWRFYINMDKNAYCTKAAWSRMGRSGSLEVICA